MAFTYHTILTSQIPHGSLAAAHGDWDLAILCWVEIWHTCTCGLCGVCQRDLSCWSPFTTCLCINHILQEPLNTTTVPWLTTAAVTKEKGWIKCVDVLMIHWCNFLKICNIQYPGQRIATFVIWGWYISSLVILSSSFQSPRTPCSLKWGEFYHVSFILWQVCVCVCVEKKRVVVLAPKWKQNRCHLVQAVYVTEGPQRWTLDVWRDVPLLVSNMV